MVSTVSATVTGVKVRASSDLQLAVLGWTGF